MNKIKTAIIGSGNIATDLMIKIVRKAERIELAAMAGIDPQSDGLARARRLGVATTDAGIEGLLRLAEFRDVKLVFDATSAQAHLRHAPLLKKCGVKAVDLTPAAVGPFVVPPVNLSRHYDADNISMVTCGGQATIPIVHAVSRVARVHYAEIVASIASRSAGPGTRANIDEFTRTTAQAIESVGGAARGKAIIILNPAEPPLMMRDTVFALSEDASAEAVKASIQRMVAEVQTYVPGYRLKQEIQFERIGSNRPLKIPGLGEFTGLKTSVFLEVEGAAHYLPKYAGNLDIMTSAALAAAEQWSAGLVGVESVA